jgi:hypothetical protein
MKMCVLHELVKAFLKMPVEQRRCENEVCVYILQLNAILYMQKLADGSLNLEGKLWMGKSTLGPYFVPLMAETELLSSR